MCVYIFIQFATIIIYQHPDCQNYSLIYLKDPYDIKEEKLLVYFIVVMTQYAMNRQWSRLT